LIADLPAAVESATEDLKKKRAGMWLSSSPDPRGMTPAQVERLHQH
jgi:hypothetical protein